MHKLVHILAQVRDKGRQLRARCDQAADQLDAAYMVWCHESAATREAYSRCCSTTRRRVSHDFASYFAALDREERAAATYAACVEHVQALASTQAGRGDGLGRHWIRTGTSASARETL